jgi:hypothetical protein
VRTRVFSGLPRFGGWDSVCGVPRPLAASNSWSSTWMAPSPGHRSGFVPSPPSAIRINIHMYSRRRTLVPWNTEVASSYPQLVGLAAPFPLPTLHLPPAPPSLLANPFTKESRGKKKRTACRRRRQDAGPVATRNGDATDAPEGATAVVSERHRSAPECGRFFCFCLPSIPNGQSPRPCGAVAVSQTWKVPRYQKKVRGGRCCTLRDTDCLDITPGFKQGSIFSSLFFVSDHASE